MSVRSVWGRIQGRDAVQVDHQGSAWIFQVPPWAVSPIIVEIWAEDEAGNISYATGVFTIEDGTVKCIRWRKEGSSLVMLADHRPTILDGPMMSHAEDTVKVSAADIAEVRPRAEMLPHICPRMEMIT